MYTNILITGGAGFVGSNLGVKIKTDYPDCNVIAFDNLKRRGSELILQRLKTNNVSFVHGDVRNKEDLNYLQKIDLIIDCSAEPSVSAGADGSPEYVVNTNLMGTINCLELARYQKADFLFLSTNRVYPIETLRNINYSENDSRFIFDFEQQIPGISSEFGVSEAFPLTGNRSFYGASKLASELFIEEYSNNFGLRTIINRCGVIAGPWQMGKVDQGFLVHWVSQHIFDGELKYFGYQGSGKQVRDVLHIDDLYELVKTQLEQPELFQGEIFNVGGGTESSTSLKELTDICQSATQRFIEISQAPHQNNLDIPIYITDQNKLTALSGWKPNKNVENVVNDVNEWIIEYEQLLKPVFLS